MKRFLMVSLVTCALSSFTTQAQEVSKDSIKTLKQEKQNLEISKRLNENKLKLATLENMVQQKTNDVSSSTGDAQKAATDNQQTAQKLSDDPQDKKLAKRARKDAKHAEKAARAGRNAADDLSDLQKDILKLKKKIAEDEARLGIVTGLSVQ